MNLFKPIKRFINEVKAFKKYDYVKRLNDLLLPPLIIHEGKHEIMQIECGFIISRREMEADPNIEERIRLLRDATIEKIRKDIVKYVAIEEWEDPETKDTNYQYQLFVGVPK